MTKEKTTIETAGDIIQILDNFTYVEKEEIIQMVADSILFEDEKVSEFVTSLSD